LNDVHILHDTFLCNLLEQNGYLLSEIFDLIVNTFSLKILIPGDKLLNVFIQTELRKSYINSVFT